MSAFLKLAVDLIDGDLNPSVFFFPRYLTHVKELFIVFVEF